MLSTTRMLIMLACMAAGCSNIQTFKLVNGQWKSTGTLGEKLQEGEGASGEESAAQGKAAHLMLGGGVSPNPRVAEAQVGEASWRLSEAYKECRGTVGVEPAARLEVTSPLQKIRVDTSAPAMFIKEPDGEAYCVDGNGRDRGSAFEWAQMDAGTYELYLGERSGYEAMATYTLRVEDKSASLTLDWSTQNVETLDINGSPEVATLRSFTLPQNTSWMIPDADDDGTSDACQSRAWYWSQALYLLEVKKPSEVGFWMQSSRASGDVVDVLGPIADDGRSYGSKICVEPGTEQVILEPGRYVMLYGNTAQDTPAYVNVAIFGEAPEPWSSIPVPPTLPDAGSMELTRFYPFLDLDTGLTDEDRVRLLKNAPEALWFVANFDMDELSAQPWPQSRKRVHPPLDEAQYPREHELLLRLSGKLYMAVDGSLYTIAKPDYLTRAVDTPNRTLPEGARPLHDTREEALAWAEQQAPERLAEHEAGVKACGGDRGCVKALDEALWKALVETRTRYRQGLLKGRVLPRLSTTLGVGP